MPEAFVPLSFLRPAWLLLVPVVLLAWTWWYRHAIHRSSGWEAEVDPDLRPYVIETGDQPAPGARLRGPLALLIGWLLALLILSGPVFERRAVPVFEAPASTVILFDLSRSMLSTDLPPDRITRARYKVTDLLQRSDAVGSRFALVGFAERPYVISPLTDDAGMLDTFVRSLGPDIVPVQGSRLDLAIGEGVQLLEGAGATGGALFLLTDQQPQERDMAAARRAAAAGHRLSVLGVGTTAGTPLRLDDGQFAKRPDGAIVVPRLDPEALSRLADAGGGRFAMLTSDDRDLTRLQGAGATTPRTPPAGLADESDEVAGRQRFWIERGPWLLWPLALAALWLFRRRVDADDPPPFRS